jgi:hypothetical protein
MMLTLFLICVIIIKPSHVEIANEFERLIPTFDYQWMFYCLKSLFSSEVYQNMQLDTEACRREHSKRTKVRKHLWFNSCSPNLKMTCQNSACVVIQSTACQVVVLLLYIFTSWLLFSCERMYICAVMLVDFWLS